MDIGKVNATKRTKKNMSRGTLAIKAGCTSRAIEYWEKGKRGISLEYADKIFKALGETITIGAKNDEE